MTTRAEVAEHIRRMRRPQRRIGRSGSPPFHATAETKALVKALAGMRLTRIEICKLVIDDDDAIAEFERLLDRIRAARTIDGSATEVRQDTGADVVPLSPRRNA